MSSEQQNSATALLDRLKDRFGAEVLESKLNLGDAELRVKREIAEDFFTALKRDFAFDLCISVTAVDYLDNDFLERAEVERYDVVYHFLATSTLDRLRVKIAVPEEQPEVWSISALWSGANYMEREAWDMYGVVFTGHPELRRILMYDEFKGHPLRKDYPVQGKQPRIPLRSPEVHNTAQDMQRASLVRINARKKAVERPECGQWVIF